jgi:HSP20 family protein
MSDRNVQAPWRQRGTQIRPFADLQSEINNLFHGLWRGVDLEPVQSRTFAPSTFRPAVDINETDTSYEIRTELPSLDENDIELTLSDSALTLKGEKKYEHDEKKSEVHVSERSYGSFRRSFSLPQEADSENIAAAFDNGVLTVTVPKTKMAQNLAKKITIEKA